MRIKNLSSFPLVLATLVVAGRIPATAQQPVPAGPEFQINVATTEFQGNPAVAARDDGSFIVVWESDAVDDGDLMFRIFDSVGAVLVDETQVNSYTTGEQAIRQHAIDAFEDGSFVVVWDSTDAADDDGGTSVHGRRFASNGAPQGLQFQINTQTSGDQIQPRVVTLPDGGFAAVWSSETALDPVQPNILLRRWSSTGEALGDAMQVNEPGQGNHFEPSIVRLRAGHFFVVWTRERTMANDLDDKSIQGRRLLSDGTPIGGQFQINAYDDDDQDTPSVAVGPAGTFVVAWRSYGSPGTDQSGSSTHARRFASDGMMIGSPFQINSFTPGNNDDAKLVFDPFGGFLVVWESEPDEVGGTDSPDGSGNAARGQRFLFDGTPVGQELALSTLTEGNQDDPAVVLSGQRAIVLFESASSAGDDSSEDSLQGRFFDVCQGTAGADNDKDGVPDHCDLCQGDNAGGDNDADGICADLDICLGDDSTGDADSDGVCADRDCNEGDPANLCFVFADSFESGDAGAWSLAVPPSFRFPSTH